MRVCVGSFLVLVALGTAVLGGMAVFGQGQNPIPSRFSGIGKAAEQGTVDDVRHFLTRGMLAGLPAQDNINGPVFQGNTSLHRAAEHNPRVDVLEFIIAQGADVNIQNNLGETALNLADTDKKREILRAATAKLPPPRNGLDAASRGTVEQVQPFLTADSLAQTDHRGRTLLHLAAQSNPDVEVVKLLVEKGCDVSAKCQQGRTPLSYAAEYNFDKGVVQYLVSQKSNINAKDNNGGTSLLYAAGRCYDLDVVKFLISEGGDIKTTNTLGENALHFAARFNPNVEVLKYFVSEGFDVNAGGTGGTGGNFANSGPNMRPLAFAAKFNSSLEVIEYLIAAGADVLKANDGGWTPLHEAVRWNPNEDVIKCLIARGADVNARDRSGITPFSLSSWNSTTEVVKLFIEKGAYVNAIENSGRTPLDRANTEEKRNLIIEAGGRSGREAASAF